MLPAFVEYMFLAASSNRPWCRVTDCAFSNLIFLSTRYLEMVRNEKTSLHVKFNAMEAMEPDVLLILPRGLEPICGALHPRSWCSCLIPYFSFSWLLDKVKEAALATFILRRVFPPGFARHFAVGLGSDEPAIEADNSVVTASICYERRLSETAAIRKIRNILRGVNWGPHVGSQLDSLNVKLKPYVVIQVLKGQKDPRLAVHFFNWAKGKQGYKHTPVTYAAMLTTLGEARQFRGAWHLLEVMRRDGREITVRTFVPLLQIYGKFNMVTEALEAHDRMTSFGCQPNVMTFTFLIGLLARNGDHEKVCVLFEKMRESGLVLDVHAYNVVIDAFGRAGNFDSMVALLQELIGKGMKPNSYTGSAFLSHLTETAHAEQGLEIFIKVVLAELDKVNASSCNLFLAALDKEGNTDMSCKLFNEMKARGYAADVMTYNILIHSLVKAGRVEEAEKYFEKMRDDNCSPDKVTFSVLIGMLGKAGKVENAHDLFREMITKGVAPDVVTYNSLIDISGKAGNTQQALQLFHEMECKGVFPDVYTYNILIYGLGKQGQGKAAYDLFKKMISTGHTPDVITFNHLIDALGRSGAVDLALELLKHMPRHGCTPDHATYTILIDRLGKGGDLQASKDLFKEMLVKGCKPSSYTFNSLIDNLCLGGFYDEAHHLYNQMKDAGCPPNHVTYTILLRAALRAKDLARLPGLVKAVKSGGLRMKLIVPKGAF